MGVRVGEGEKVYMCVRGVRGYVRASRPFPVFVLAEYKVAVFLGLQ